MNIGSNLGFVCIGIGIGIGICIGIGIGIGIMSEPMTSHQRAAGHTIFVTTRSQVPVALPQAGAVTCADAADVAGQADINVTRVPDMPATPDMKQLPLRQRMGKKMTHVGGNGSPPRSRSVWQAHCQTHLQPGLSHQTAPEGFEPGAQAERRRQIG